MQSRPLFRMTLLIAVVALLPLAPAFAGGLEIGPVPGLTTTWHAAPVATAIPWDGTTTLKFRQRVAPHGTSVLWSGATEVSRDEQWSIAECSLAEAGRYTISATMTWPNGAQVEERAVLDALPIRPDAIHISKIRVAVDPVEIDETDVNASTFEYFRGPSVAGLHKVSENWYRTSTRRPIHLSVEVEPAVFAPLIEWRSPEKVPRLGSTQTFTHLNPQIQRVVAGPTASPEAVFLQTYSVEITSHLSDHDVIPQGEPITFTAVTNPPGYEKDITWLASTSYGQTDPILHQGAAFTVRFDDTFRVDEDGTALQWLGVRADNALFNQDQKADVPPGRDCLASEIEGTLVSFAENPIPADFFFPGSEPFQGEICFEGTAEENVCDVAIDRLEPMSFDGPLESLPTAETDILVSELRMESCERLEITGENGALQVWDVDVSLSDFDVPTGTLTATKTHANGGTFTASFFVQPRFTFTLVDPQDQAVRVLDTGIAGFEPLEVLDGNDVTLSWVHQLNPDSRPFYFVDPSDPEGENNFVPGIVEDPSTGNQSQQVMKWPCPNQFPFTRHCFTRELIRLALDLPSSLP